MQLCAACCDAGTMELVLLLAFLEAPACCTLSGDKSGTLSVKEPAFVELSAMSVSSISRRSSFPALDITLAQPAGCGTQTLVWPPTCCTSMATTGAHNTSLLKIRPCAALSSSNRTHVDLLLSACRFLENPKKHPL